MKECMCSAGITSPRTSADGRHVGNPTPRRAALASCLLGVLVCLVVAEARAEALQDPASIRRAALAFAASLPIDMPGERSFEAAPLDPRLRLDRCPAPLEASASEHQQGTRQTTIRVHCPLAPGWTLYVPVLARYRMPVVVAAAGLSRGEVIGREHVRLEERELSRSDLGLLQDPAEAIGMQLRRPVAGGTPLRASALEAVDVIQRGDRVVIDAVRAGFRVRMQGESLQDAAPGERVRVRNLSSRRVVQGIAGADGTVRVLR